MFSTATILSSTSTTATTTAANQNTTLNNEDNNNNAKSFIIFNAPNPRLNTFQTVFDAINDLKKYFQNGFTQCITTVASDLSSVKKVDERYKFDSYLAHPLCIVELSKDAASIKEIVSKMAKIEKKLIQNQTSPNNTLLSELTNLEEQLKSAIVSIQINKRLDRNRHDSEFKNCKTENNPATDTPYIIFDGNELIQQGFINTPAKSIKIRVANDQSNLTSLEDPITDGNNLKGSSNCNTSPKMK